MKIYVKLLIQENTIRSTPSIYISMMIAYLKSSQWKEAERIANFLESMSLKHEEACACHYLRRLALDQDEKQIEALLTYLGA